MYRFVSVIALAMMAACATTDEPRLDRFDTVDIGGLADFTAYDTVYLVPSVASDEVIEQTQIASFRPGQDEQPLDEADITKKLADYDDTLKKALGAKVTLVEEAGPGVLVVKTTVTALESNRPDLTRAGRSYPGVTRVFAIGGAASTFTFSVDGEAIGTLSDTDNEQVLTQSGFLPIGVWETVDRYFDRSAANLASLF